MYKFFSLKNLPYFSIFTLIWGNYLAIKIDLPYFVISIPFILGSIYIIFTSLLHFNKHKQTFFQTKKVQSFIYLTIVTYSIATIIKISIIPSQQDFLRNTLFIIGAMHGTSCILFLDNPILLKGIHSRILKLYPYILFLYFFLS